MMLFAFYRYYDGCNDCTGCQEDRQACTQKFCTPEAYGDAYCTGCVDGYELINGACEEKCLGFENCSSYSDGCNTCSCVDGETLGCTKLVKLFLIHSVFCIE